jgi:hypothetical protein
MYLKSNKNIKIKDILLCHFEDSEKTEGPEGRQPKTSGAFVEVDPEDLEDGAGDDDGVEAVEGGGKEGGRTESIHTYVHLEDKGTKEQKFGVNWKRKKMFILMTFY